MTSHASHRTTAFGNSHQHTDFSESKDGTHIDVAGIFLGPNAIHTFIKEPFPCSAVVPFRRRPKRVNAIFECILVLIGDILHPSIQSGGNVSLFQPCEITGVRRVLLIFIRQSRTAAQVSQDVPQLTRRRKVPAGIGQVVL